MTLKHCYPSPMIWKHCLRANHIAHLLYCNSQLLENFRQDAIAVNFKEIEEAYTRKKVHRAGQVIQGTVAVRKC